MDTKEFEIKTLVESAIAQETSVRFAYIVFDAYFCTVYINNVCKKFKTPEQAGAYFLGYVTAICYTM